MRWKIVAAAALSALAAACAPLLPEQPPAAKAVWLDQAWNNEQRFWYHHETQGTSTFPVPYTWFMALEQPQLVPTKVGKLSDSAYLQGFGFIPSPRSLAEAVAEGYPADGGGSGVVTAYYGTEKGENPDGLPVGFARTKGYTDPTTGEPVPDQIGLTCAACHTGHMTYKGTDIRVDGGPAYTDLGKFSIALGESLLFTTLEAPRFDRFAKDVFAREGKPDTPENRAALKAGLKAVLEALAAQGKVLGTTKKQNVEEGFGRLDALNRIGNQVFVTDLWGAEGFNPLVNVAPTNAPVNYPHIWNTSWFEWVQYDASIMEPMVRNAGESLGVAAKVNLINPKRPLFGSSVAVDNIYQMESLLAGPDPLKQPVPGFAGLRSPPWPEAILGAVDTAKAAHGKALYAELCQGCHLPPVNDPESDLWKPEYRDRYWTTPTDIVVQVPVDQNTTRTEPFNTNGERYLKLPEVPVVEIGTDPAQASVLTARQVAVPCWLDLAPAQAQCEGRPDSSWVQISFAAALGDVVQNTTKRWYQDHGTSHQQQEAMNGWRPNHLQALLVYKARPLDGIWATGPFLHNGAVPTLMALLSPVAERPQSFCVGVREFDPVNVGYVTTCESGTNVINTSIPGNLNTGHEFRDGPLGNGVIGRGLTVAEREALVEYLKTL